jgi:hypothetical protein
VELARGPEAQDVAKNEEGGGKDGERELMEKAAGDHGLYNLARGSAWQMESAPTPIPNAAGGEGGHGAARPDGVIHRCNSPQTAVSFEPYMAFSGASPHYKY